MNETLSVLFLLAENVENMMKSDLRRNREIENGNEGVLRYSFQSKPMLICIISPI